MYAHVTCSHVLCSMLQTAFKLLRQTTILLSLVSPYILLWLLPISRHLEHHLYKYNHLFFHFTFLTTLIQHLSGEHSRKFFSSPDLATGEQKNNRQVCSPLPRANIPVKH